MEAVNPKANPGLQSVAVDTGGHHRRPPRRWLYQGYPETQILVEEKGHLTAHKVNKGRLRRHGHKQVPVGKTGATVSVTLPNGQVKSAAVETNGQWTINLGTTVPMVTILSVTQTMTNFKDNTQCL